MAAVIGGAVGWVAHKLGEVGRQDAVVAHSKEMIRAARKARDRERVELEEAQERLDQIRGEHHGCEDRIRELGRELREARESGSGSSAKLAEMQELRGNLRKITERLNQQRTEAETAHEQVARLELEAKELVSARAVLERQETEMTSLQTRLDDACKKLDEEGRLLASRTSEMHRLSAELEELGAEHHRSEQSKRELEETHQTMGTELERFRSEAAHLQRELQRVETAHAGCDAEHHELKQAADQLEAELARCREELGSGAPSWLEAAPQTDGDDLQAIRGIGPVFENRLNELGVYHYRQLAQLSARDTGWIAFRLSTPPDRIARERWAAQAGKLDAKKKRG